MAIRRHQGLTRSRWRWLIGMVALLALLAPLALVIGSGSGTPQPHLPTEHIECGQSAELRVELATTPEQRERGLMFRETLHRDSGMLFVYESDAILTFWMRNTSIPLSIAYLDDEGHIINIDDMQPHTWWLHGSGAPARYALEVHQGWFAEQNITAGDRCTLPN